MPERVIFIVLTFVTGGGVFYLLNKIKIEALKVNISMTELSFKIGCSREYMYREIKKNNPVMLKRIKKILPRLDTNVSKDDN